MKKLLCIVLSMIFAFSGICVSANAGLSEYSILEFYNMPCTIKNSKGQTLNFNGISDFSGDFK